jgi:hypothetical protein
MSIQIAQSSRCQQRGGSLRQAAAQTSLSWLGVGYLSHYAAAQQNLTWGVVTLETNLEGRNGVTLPAPQCLPHMLRPASGSAEYIKIKHPSCALRTLGCRNSAPIWRNIHK